MLLAEVHLTLGRIGFGSFDLVFHFLTLLVLELLVAFIELQSSLEVFECKFFGDLGIVNAFKIRQFGPNQALREAIELKIFVIHHSRNDALIIEEVENEELQLLAEEFSKANVDARFDIGHFKRI